MLPETGTLVPKTGTIVPVSESAATRERACAQLIASALRAELGESRRANKTVIAWTGAGERTVKHWLAGSRAPSGVHLIALARHSDRILGVFLSLAGRAGPTASGEIVRAKVGLAEALEIVSRMAGDAG